MSKTLNSNDQLNQLIEKVNAIEKSGNVQHESLQKVSEKVDEVKKRLSDKWVLPVMLAILGTILTLINFFIQRNFNNADVSKKKQQEIIASFIAESKVDFYKKCRLKLNDIDQKFESYCLLGRSDQVEASLDTALYNFKEFADGQQVIDPKVIKPIKEYSEFVANTAFDLAKDAPSATNSKKAYENSTVLFKESIAAIDKGIQQIQQ